MPPDPHLHRPAFAPPSTPGPVPGNDVRRITVREAAADWALGRLCHYCELARRGNQPWLPEHQRRTFVA